MGVGRILARGATKGFFATGGRGIFCQGFCHGVHQGIFPKFFWGGKSGKICFFPLETKKTTSFAKFFKIQEGTSPLPTPMVQTWGRHTCFLPRAPSNPGTPLYAVHSNFAGKEQAQKKENILASTVISYQPTEALHIRDSKKTCKMNKTLEMSRKTCWVKTHTTQCMRGSYIWHQAFEWIGGKKLAIYFEFNVKFAWICWKGYTKSFDDYVIMKTLTWNRQEEKYFWLMLNSERNCFVLKTRCGLPNKPPPIICAHLSLMPSVDLEKHLTTDNVFIPASVEQFK